MGEGVKVNEEGELRRGVGEWEVREAEKRVMLCDCGPSEEALLVLTRLRMWSVAGMQAKDGV